MQKTECGFWQYNLVISRVDLCFLKFRPVSLTQTNVQKMKFSFFLKNTILLPFVNICQHKLKTSLIVVAIVIVAVYALRAPAENFDVLDSESESELIYLTENWTITTSAPAQIHDEFLIFYDYFPAKIGETSAWPEFSNPNTVTVAYHCTFDFIHLLPNQVETWDGPISLAVYFHFLNDQFSKFVEALQNLHVLHECGAKIGQKVSVHLVFPKADQRNLMAENGAEKNWCRKSWKFLTQFYGPKHQLHQPYRVGLLVRLLSQYFSAPKSALVSHSGNYKNS